MTTVCMIACVILGIAIGAYIGFDMAYRRILALQLPMVKEVDNFLNLARVKDYVKSDKQNESEGTENAPNE